MKMSAGTFDVLNQRATRAVGGRGRITHHGRQLALRDVLRQRVDDELLDLALHLVRARRARLRCERRYETAQQGQ